MAALGLGLKEQAVGATGLCTGKAARKRRTNDRIGFKVLFSIGVAQVRALLSFILHSQKVPCPVACKKKKKSSHDTPSRVHADPAGFADQS